MERITAVFESAEHAQCAIDKLKSVGITDVTFTTVKNNKMMSVLQQDVSLGCSRGIIYGTLLGALVGVYVALWTAFGPLVFSGVIGVTLTALMGAVLGAVLGSVFGTFYDLRCKAHQPAVRATSEHEGKPMVAVDVTSPDDQLKVEDVLKTLGGEVVTTPLPVTAPAPAQMSH